MKVRPLQDRVLVRRIAEEEKTKGGIIIPDTAKEKPAEAEVIAVGNGKVDDKGTLRPLTVKKGDRVLFGKYSGNEIKIDGVDHLILREDDILGVLEEVRRHHGSQRDSVRRGGALPHPGRRQRAGRHGQGDARAARPQRRHREVLGRPDGDQGRRHRGQGDRARGQVRQPRRADGQGGRLQDLRHRRRRDDDGDGAGAGDLPRGGQDGGRRPQPDGAQARDGEGGREDRRGAQEDLQADQGAEGRRPGRDDQRQRRRVHRQDHRRGDGEGRQGRRRHHRGGQVDGDHARRRRGDAVRSRLHLALLRDRRGADGGQARRPVHPDPREEHQQHEGPAAGPRAGGALRQAAADHRRGRG